MAQFTIRQEQTGDVRNPIDYFWVFQDSNQLPLAFSAARYSTVAAARGGIDSLLRALTTGTPVVEEVARPTVATVNRVLGDVSFSVERSSDVVSLASPTVAFASSRQEAEIIRPPSPVTVAAGQLAPAPARKPAVPVSAPGSGTPGSGTVAVDRVEPATASSQTEIRLHVHGENLAPGISVRLTKGRQTVPGTIIDHPSQTEFVSSFPLPKSAGIWQLDVEGPDGSRSNSVPVTVGVSGRPDNG